MRNPHAAMSAGRHPPEAWRNTRSGLPTGLAPPPMTPRPRRNAALANCPALRLPPRREDVPWRDRGDRAAGRALRSGRGRTPALIAARLHGAEAGGGAARGRQCRRARRPEGPAGLPPLLAAAGRAGSCPPLPWHPGASPAPRTGSGGRCARPDHGRHQGAASPGAAAGPVPGMAARRGRSSAATEKRPGLVRRAGLACCAGRPGA